MNPRVLKSQKKRLADLVHKSIPMAAWHCNGIFKIRMFSTLICFHMIQRAENSYLLLQ